MDSGVSGAPRQKSGILRHQMNYIMEGLRLKGRGMLRVKLFSFVPHDGIWRQTPNQR